MIDGLILAAGFLGIAAGARFALTYAIEIARHHGLSDFFVGVVLLAIGTDLPEIVVSINAAIRHTVEGGMSGLIVGNAIGSCFGQIGLTLGAVALMAPLGIARRDGLVHGGTLLVSTVMLFAVALSGSIERLEGALLVLVYLGYVGVLFAFRKPRQAPQSEDYRGWRVWARLAAALIVVVVAADAIVVSATNLAASWSLDPTVVGIVVLGIGTSLPELSLSVAAILQRRHAMSVGNLIGSNILDTLLPIGLAAMIVPLDVTSGVWRIDLPILFALTALACAFLLSRGGMIRPKAVALLAIYGIYVGFRIIRA